jgi:hypothetical protein
LYGVARVAVADITVLELQRQAVDDAKDVDKKFRAAASDASRLGVDVTVPTISVRPSDWLVAFEARLESRGIEIARHAEPRHSDLIDRDLRRLPPFKSSGEGYRDALIWLTFLNWVGEVSPEEGDTLLFVSNNTQQFAVPGATTLSPVLQKEARDRGYPSVALIPDRTRFVDLARELSREASQASVPEEPAPGDQEVIENEVRSALERLAGEEFDILGRLELGGVAVLREQELPEAYDASVVWAEPIGGVIDAFAVDAFDETTELWEAVAEAILWIEGRMDAHDLHQLPRTARVHTREWTDESLVGVEFPLAVRLRFDVRLELAGASSAELVGASVLPEERWRWQVEHSLEWTEWDPI